MFEIEKNVPMDGAGNRISWPWKDMEVGDSVFFDSPEIAKKAQPGCHMYGRQSGKKFATRSSNDGLRVWRVA